MAKQKKKKSQHKHRTPPKERRKFDLLLILPFAAIIGIRLNYERVNYFCSRLFSDGNGYFYQIKLNPFIILFYLMLPVIVFMFYNYVDNAKELDITVKEYYSRKNPRAKKQIKAMVIKTSAAVLLCAVFFCLGGTRKCVGEKDAVVTYSTFGEDRKELEYTDVTGVDVTMKYKFSSGWRIHIPGRYYINIKLKTESAVFEITDDDFCRNYDKINSFLNIFDESIITCDNESREALR